MTPVEERIDHEEAKRIAEWAGILAVMDADKFDGYLDGVKVEPLSDAEIAALACAYLDLLAATEPAQPEEEPRG